MIDLESRLRTVVGAVALMGIAALPTSTAEAASATANAGVSIVAAIGIGKTADLDFASVVPAASANTVVVSTAGARTCGSPLTCTGTVAAAGFSVTGGANLGYTITPPK